MITYIMAPSLCDEIAISKLYIRILKMVFLWYTHGITTPEIRLELF